MRVGVLIDGNGLTLDELFAQVRPVAGDGLDSAWFNQVLAWDAITVAALCAREVPGIQTGTAVTQTYPRHPVALASQALTAQVISGGRFTLGIGPSHRPVIEGMLGYSYDRPAAHTREYLSALRPLLRGERADYHGETITAVGQVDVPGATPPPVLVSALGPAMLRIAGELADGTITVWAGPQLIADYVVPAITSAAERAGRPAPRIVAIAPMILTTDPDGARERAGATPLAGADQLPAYRAVLDRQGMVSALETLIAGDERTIEQAVRAYADAGTTDLVASLHGDHHDQSRTRDLLSLLRAAQR